MYKNKITKEELAKMISNGEDISETDYSHITDMSSMFQMEGELITIPLLDTRNVTNMESMFENCYNLEYIPLLDTNNVTCMDFMFYQCTKLKYIPPLNTEKVTTMESMFTACIELTTIPKLNTCKLLNARDMFVGCTNLTTLPILVFQDYCDMDFMLYDCVKLKGSFEDWEFKGKVQMKNIVESPDRLIELFGFDKTKDILCRHSNINNFKTKTYETIKTIQELIPIVQRELL